MPRYYADLHVHSRYSRATSPDMNPEGLHRWAMIKGIGLIGTGDFTHPGYFNELSEKLSPLGNGLHRLRKPTKAENVPGAAEPLFVLQAEVSCIYSKAGRTRKVHSIILAPGLSEAGRINARLSEIGNLKSDGRPILGLDARLLLEIVLEEAPGALVIPAHIWTPHFSLFGAASGFDSIEECYGDLSAEIFAMETGLSADPAMCRRLSALDHITLVSNSDAHSPSKLGREANILDTELSYEALVNALRTRKGFLGTVEFFPEEGKYHHDGHRKCEVSMHPAESRKVGNICPSCGKPMTIGVLHRVMELADRDGGFRHESGRPTLFDAPAKAATHKAPPDTPHTKIIPLEEVISQVMGRGVNTKGVQQRYHALVQTLGPEFSILMGLPVSEIEAVGGQEIAMAIGRMRRGEVELMPGYDGEYGVVKVTPS